ncbi:MAG TPA: TetR/AcrR family transcriptional regulator [Actinomycetota bacterium]|jgi:AcrR family transcriptional regulator|nr:TetR/AcrR family transcriptional regulator [Actinomycetota bacterium]
MTQTGKRAYTMRARADGVAATRGRIVRAMLRLALEQAYEDITLAAIAAAAGVSHQTVINHFESKEGVAFAVADLLREETGVARAKARPGDVKGAVSVLVGEYERIGDANVRWALTAERLGRLAPLLDEARAGHQEWIRRVFADRLPEPPAERRHAVNALHAATDVYIWKLLRRDLKLSRAETVRSMVDLVNGILDRQGAARRPGEAAPGRAGEATRRPRAGDAG